ncbi:Major Facilitator Superfamily protein [Micromonospora rhizosphaerae]|uniref:Major Facilitator Superfamily protein n=1 Tax=Micromonospora rhizosphaerae TaxID=568872 RepID=A0A1C6RCY7_9ACTN|nr:MFS transporter [Micromonospora rhizosphaerae]SCL15016.1 Major Facilitator Superfamily protein [Micromonospora rhizosphaerae]
MGIRDTIRTAVSHVVPPAGLTRALAVQAMVYAIGHGLFQAGSAVFFTRALGLSPTQVGLGLSLAAGVSLLGTVPLGALTDRYGAQRVWLVGLLAEAALFAAYPFVGGFAGFLAVVVALAVVDASAGVARSVYSINVLPPDQRVTALAYQRSALNVGFGLGAVISGVVLALDTMVAYRGMVWFNAAMLLVTAVFVVRLPRVPVAPRSVEKTSRLAVLTDRPFMAVSLLAGLLSSHGTLYLVVLPLWVLSHTDAPRTLIAALVLLNTILAVLLQVRASRGAEAVAGAGRALRTGGLLIALFCLILPISALTSGVVTIAVLVVAAVVLTLAELVQSAGAWGITSTMPPAAHRGAYVGAFRLGGQLQYLAAPAGLTALGVSTGGWGWLPMAALFGVAAVAAVPLVDWAARRPRLGEDEVVAIGEPATVAS